MKSSEFEEIYRSGTLLRDSGDLADGDLGKSAFEFP